MSTHETVGEKLARLSAAVRERGLNAGALGVAVALWSFADSRIGEAFPSLSDLCGRALVSERCAQTHLRDLESNGLVWVIRRDMTPVNGGVADPPLATLVQRDREGSPCAVPHGRNLYLVRPLASQAAVDAHGAASPSGDLRAWLASWLPRITRTRRHHGNHRYVFALSRAAKRVVPASLPYPKFDARACRAMGVTPDLCPSETSGPAALQRPEPRPTERTFDR